MKEIEAPDKIYVHWSKHAKRLCASAAQGKGDIEYTRTDAFVEKACEWLLTNASDYCILHNSYDTKELVKDFVDAMKRD